MAIQIIKIFIQHDIIDAKIVTIKIVPKDCAKRAKDNKHYALEKLGGKCQKCNYNKCVYALDIHHLNPSIKDSKFHHKGGWSRERLDKELENCILLCANCHREEHYL